LDVWRFRWQANPDLGRQGRRRGLAALEALRMLGEGLRKHDLAGLMETEGEAAVHRRQSHVADPRMPMPMVHA
jgi:hypothetical protein